MNANDAGDALHDAKQDATTTEMRGARPGERSMPPRHAAAAAMPRVTDRSDSSHVLPDPRELLWLVGRLFRPNAIVEGVTTTARFDGGAEQVWQRMMFYEEVPQRPPLLLRLFLPAPVRTQSAGKQVGSVVECTYTRGTLMKRITALEPPRLVRFEVLEQRLGVERCVTTVEGSYEIRPAGRGCEVALTTRYRGHLRPRWLLRPFERLLAHQLHRHILKGMGARRGP